MKQSIWKVIIVSTLLGTSVLFYSYIRNYIENISYKPLMFLGMNDEILLTKYFKKNGYQVIFDELNVVERGNGRFVRISIHNYDSLTCGNTNLKMGFFQYKLSYISISEGSDNPNCKFDEILGGKINEKDTVKNKYNDPKVNQLEFIWISKFS